MADTYDPYSGQRKALDRRSAVMQALMASAMQPRPTQMAGRVAIRQGPLDAIGRVATSYLSSKGLEKTDQQYADLDAKRVAAEQAALEQVLTPGVNGDAPDYRAGMASPYDSVRSVSETLYKNAQPKRQVVEQYDEHGQPRKVLVDLNNPDDTRPFGGSKAPDRNKPFNPDGSPNQAYMDYEMARRAAGKSPGSSAQPYFSPVDTSSGLFRFNHRDGSAVPLDVDGKPLMRSTSDPALQGEIAGARAEGKAGAIRTFNMDGLGDTIARAEALLSGTSGKALPTGSTIGSLYDAAAGVVGMSPEGADEAQTMKSIGAALLSKMPRMEGPQSDRDSQLYREMAAAVGDDTLPRSRRLAALEQVKQMWGKYEAQNAPAAAAQPAPASTPPQGVPPDLWGAMTPEERALWQ